MYRREILICARRYTCVCYLCISSMYNLRTARRRCQLWQWRPRKRGDTRARAYVLSLLPSYVHMHTERTNWAFDSGGCDREKTRRGGIAAAWYTSTHTSCLCVTCMYACKCIRCDLCVYACMHIHTRIYTHHTSHITHTHNNENVGDSRG